MNVRTWIAFGVATAVSACGGGSSSGGGGTGSCNPTMSTGFTLSSAGVTPKAVCVLPAGTVTFTNNDTAAHDIQSSGGCPDLVVGSLAPSSQKSVVLSTVETCTFHDASNPTNTAFVGTIAVNNATVSGPGY